MDEYDESASGELHEREDEWHLVRSVEIERRQARGQDTGVRVTAFLDNDCS